MATKKSASKKTAGAEAGTATPAEKKGAGKGAAKKTAAKQTPAKKAAGEAPAAERAHTMAKAKPTHHDISVQAYLLWERDGRKHGHHDQYWQQAEKELNS